MIEIEIYDLADEWVHSTGTPNELYAQTDPEVHGGAYMIEPGERVPATGTTSHSGPELSVILAGEVVVGVPSGERTVGAGCVTVIPAGVEHYSENRGDEPVHLVYTVVGSL